MHAICPVRKRHDTGAFLKTHLKIQPLLPSPSTTTTLLHSVVPPIPHPSPQWILAALKLIQEMGFHSNLACTRMGFKISSISTMLLIMSRLWQMRTLSASTSRPCRHHQSTSRSGFPLRPSRAWPVYHQAIRREASAAAQGRIPDCPPWFSASSLSWPSGLLTSSPW